MEHVGIVILNYNNSSDTINCIESVLKYTTVPIKIVVVDNGLNDVNSIIEISNYLTENVKKEEYVDINVKKVSPILLPKITLLKLEANLGYALGNKKGIELLYRDSSVESIMILNNDILFIENIIPDLLKELSILEKAFLVSPLLLKKDGVSIDYTCARNNYSFKEFILSYISKFFDPFSIRKKIYQKNHLLINNPGLLNEQYFEIEMPSGSCMLARKDDFRKIGDFDSNTFLYCEENILSKKVKAIGMKNYLLTQSRCIHLGASSTSKSKSSFIAKCSKDSILYYVRKYENPSFLSFYVFKSIVYADFYKVLFFNKIKKWIKK